MNFVAISVNVTIRCAVPYMRYLDIKDKLFVLNYSKMVPSVFVEEGSKIMRRARSLSTEVYLRRFKSLFGVTPIMYAILWKKTQLFVPNKSKPEYLLCGLLFLKVYASEHAHCALVGTSEKNFEISAGFLFNC